MTAIEVVLRKQDIAARGLTVLAECEQWEFGLGKQVIALNRAQWAMLVEANCGAEVMMTGLRGFRGEKY